MGLRYALRWSSRTMLYRVIESGWCVLSWFWLMQNGAKRTFPERNKLLSACIDSLTIPELNAWSGTALTYSYALKNSIPIYGFPRSVLTDSQEVSNAAMKSWSMIVSTSIYNWKVQVVWEETVQLQEREIQSNVEVNCTHEQQSLLKWMDYPCSIDLLHEKTWMPMQTILVLLTQLQLQGCCMQESPWIYVRL